MWQAGNLATPNGSEVTADKALSKSAPRCCFIHSQVTAPFRALLELDCLPPQLHLLPPPPSVSQSPWPSCPST